MDVHKPSIALAMHDPSGAVSEQTIPHEPRAILRWVRKEKSEATGPIRCAYEAVQSDWLWITETASRRRVGVRRDRTLSDPA